MNRPSQLRPTRLSTHHHTPTSHTSFHGTPYPRPPKRKRDWLRWSIVTFGILFLTTALINAADVMQTLRGQRFLGLQAKQEVRCPAEMVYVPTGEGGFCVDKYEVSPSDTCSFKNPASEIQTNENIAMLKCFPVSQQNKDPWVNINVNQAMNLCARVGKRLPTAGEWYRSALGTPDTVDPSSKDLCVLGRTGRSTAELTGTHANCISSYGAYDMVGNVWEWVDAEVVDGKLNDRKLPSEGYVSESNTSGLPVSTATTSSLLFGNDYFFLDPTGSRSMFRGGFWNLTDKAGIYAINATIQSSFTGSAVGFRCVK